MGFDSFTYTFDECLSKIIDYRGKTPHKTASGIPLITAKIVKAGRIESPDEFIATDDFERWMTRGLPECGDVVLTTEAPLGEVGQIKALPVALAQRVVTLRGKPGLLDNTYLLYALQAEPLRSSLLGRATGTTVVGIKQSELRKVEMDLPPIEIQREIARVLSVLDDRIDHNRALAANLEAIARALFKSWFVDFDPVRAKAAGEAPPGLAPDLAALFPDRFVDSELGEIPEGWQFTPLSKLAEFVNGRNFTKEATGSGRVVIRIAELSNGGPSGNTVWNDLPDTEDRYVANPGDVLFAWSGSLGVHVWEHDPGLVNQHIFKVLPRSRYCKPFCFFAVEEIIEDFRAIASGKAVTMGHIKREDLDTHGVVCPSVGALTDAFSNLVGPIWERARVAQRESLALSAMRDLLLPRLISGKLRVEDAEAALEAA